MHTPPSPRRALVVDDSVTLRAAVKRVINETPGWEVVGTAADGEQAVEGVHRLSPDVVVMDYEMPVMNGLDAIRAIRTFSRVPVLVLSGHTPRQSREAIELLAAGASDVLSKAAEGPLHGLDGLRGPLMRQLNALTGRRPVGTAGYVDSPPPRGGTPHAGSARLTVVGASTGGPPALEAFLDALPAALTAPVVIAQHMPETFTAALAERLHRRGPRPATLAEHGATLQAGTVYVAPGGQHTQVRRGLGDELKFGVGPDPADAPYRPSVDALFASAAACCHGGLVAAVLTGMGDDGLVGARAVVRAGGKVVAQDAESCVVYGMPRAVIEADLAVAALPPADLARYLGRIALRAA